MAASLRPAQSAESAQTGGRLFASGGAVPGAAAAAAGEPASATEAAVPARGGRPRGRVASALWMRRRSAVVLLGLVAVGALVLRADMHLPLAVLKSASPQVFKWDRVAYCVRLREVSPDGILPQTIFLHVPKSGGTTMQQILRRPVLHNSLDESNVRRLFADPKALLAAASVNFHGQFGLHERMNYTKHGRRWQYATLIRDPVERTLSEFRYKAAMYPRFRQYWADREWNLTAYVAEAVPVPAAELGSPALLPPILARWIATKFASLNLAATLLRRSPHETLDDVKQRLMYDFKLVGTVEQFDEFVLLAQRFLNTSSVANPYGWANVVTHADRLPFNVTEDVVRVIYERNAEDLELHRLAHDLTAAAIECYGARWGPDFVDYEIREEAWRERARCKNCKVVPDLWGGAVKEGAAAAAAAAAPAAAVAKGRTSE